MNEPCFCGALDCAACRGSDAYAEPDDDCTADLIADIRGWIDDAELQHELGNNEKALHCLREAMALLEDTLDAA
jgi:hypothetical protein